MSSSFSLVTGAGGGLGKALCQRLVDQNKQIIAIDNFCTGDKFIEHANLRAIECDIEKLPKIEEPVDEIYHLACPTGVPNLTKMPFEMLSACSIGTQNLLELALAKRAKFLLTSSSEVYGDPQVFPQSENYTGNVDPVGVRSPYEEGKRFSEALTSAYARYKGLDAKIVRVFNTFGPTFPLSDTRVITNFIQLAKQNRPLPVHGDGSQIRTFLYVEDNIDALLLIMEKGEGVYNVGSDKQITVKELAELIIEKTGSKSTIEYIERPSHDHGSRLPNLSRIHSLGWQAKVPLDQGLTKTATKERHAS